MQFPLGDFYRQFNVTNLKDFVSKRPGFEGRALEILKDAQTTIEMVWDIYVQNEPELYTSECYIH